MSKKKLKKIFFYRSLILILIILIMIIFTIFLKSTQKTLTQDVLEKIVSETKEKYDIPGIYTAVMSSDEIICSTTKGYKRMDTKKDKDKINKNDFFNIGSVSKNVLSLIAGKYVEKGSIKWDTKFFDIFPEYKEGSLKEYHNITLENLLSFEAGVQPFTTVSDKKNADVLNYPKEKFIKYIFKTNPASTAKKDGNGFEQLYSNASYTLASVMIEKASGKNYQELIDEMMNKILGFEYFIGYPTRFNKNQPFGHVVNKGKLEVVENFDMPESIIPAGAICMTPDDFTQLAQMQLKGLLGKDNYLKSKTYKYIYSKNKPSYTEKYSLGIYNAKLLGITYYGKDGNLSNMFYSRFLLVPESDFSLVIMANLGNVEAVDEITMKIAKYHFNWWWLPEFLI